MNFIESAHRFTVTAANVQQIEFGNQKFFTTLARGLPISLMEQAMLTGNALFGSSLVFPALSFHAECVVVDGGSAAQLRNDYDFGFVQGLRSANIHLEYWGKVASDGRTSVYITMPNVFEIDTDTSIQPFTRAASSRFEARDIGAGAVKVSADFTDHPLYIFPRTVSHMLPTFQRVDHHIRWVFFRREFKTVFCFRNKRDGSFTPISSTAYWIDYDHTVSYSGGTPSVAAKTSPAFPVGGSPSENDSTSRMIMQMAKAGGPLFTPAVLQNRLSDRGLRSETEEDLNSAFVSSFWT